MRLKFKNALKAAKKLMDESLLDQDEYKELQATELAKYISELTDLEASTNKETDLRDDFRAALKEARILFEEALLDEDHYKGLKAAEMKRFNRTLTGTLPSSPQFKSASRQTDSVRQQHQQQHQQQPHTPDNHLYNRPLHNRSPSIANLVTPMQPSPVRSSPQPLSPYRATSPRYPPTNSAASTPATTPLKISDRQPYTRRLFSVTPSPTSKTKTTPRKPPVMDHNRGSRIVVVDRGTYERINTPLIFKRRYRSKKRIAVPSSEAKSLQDIIGAKIDYE